MRQYKKWVTASVALTTMGALVGCGTSNGTTPANSTNSTNATNQIVSTKDNSVTRFSSGSPSKSWIQGTVAKSDSILKAGTIVNISGRLARVQRNPNIQVTLYQSKGADYKKDAIQLVQKNLPVTGSANFTGTFTVPTFDTSNGGNFTLTFKYKGVPQAFAVLLQK